MIAFFLALALLLQGAPAGPGGAAQGAVTGQIQTREGQPAAAVRVAAIPAPPPPQASTRPNDGLNYYVPPPPVRVTQTDEQGRYRLANMPPGRYLIAAGVGQATYYPGQIDALRASVVTVAADAPATVDFKLVTPLGGRVSGRVTPPPAQGSGEIAVMSGITLAEVAEIAVTGEGQFAFGRVPPGRYLVSIFPTPPGYGSLTVDVREADVTNLEIKRPTTYAVSGRVVTSHGPIPNGLLALVTDSSYVPITINPDGTFTARAHSARHRVDFGGMPGGYAMTSVGVGGRDAANSLTVGTSDIAGVVVNVTAPRDLPRIRGTIAGLSKPVTVELQGPIVGTLTATTNNGAFEIPAAIPGLYYLRVRELPQLGTTHVAVTWNGGGNVQLKAP